MAGMDSMGMQDSRPNILDDDPSRLPVAQRNDSDWSVMDLFSGCGGMSFGFARRKPFRLIAAVDAEHAKPCEGFGRLDCNHTYETNIGIRPFGRDIASIVPEAFLNELGRNAQPKIKKGDLTVFVCCPPCTDFSRAKPANHSVDSAKNSLVAKCADFVEAFMPEFVMMENSRELIMVNYSNY